MPPDVARMIGVNVACSNCRTLSSYAARFFILSSFLYADCISRYTSSVLSKAAALNTLWLVLAAVLQHYCVSSVPVGNVKVKCKYCVKEITGSVKTTTNWWKHLVSSKLYIIIIEIYRFL